MAQMTTNLFKKVCIVGAGAIGGWLGLRLAHAGCEVSVVARGVALDNIQLHGLRLQSASGVESAAVRASNTPVALGVQDLVVIAVKAQSLPGAAISITPLLGPDTVVLTAMNGIPWWFFHGFGGYLEGTRLQAIDPHGEISAAIPTSHVVGCVVHASCSVDEPGLVRHNMGNKLIVGEPSGAKTDRVRALAGLLSASGFEAVVSDQIQADVWYKLWGNMTFNPVSAITGATTDLILGDPLVREFISSVMLEARDIGARMGVPIAQDPEDRHAVTMKLGAMKTSMLQDVEAGKPVELDALVTAVKEIGDLVGLPMPHTNALLGLARLHARVRGLY